MQARVEVGILQFLNCRGDPEDQHHIVRMTDFFLCASHLCIAFELLSLNLYELIKLNQFRGLSISLVRVFLQQVRLPCRGLAWLDVIRLCVWQKASLAGCGSFSGSSALLIEVLFLNLYELINLKSLPGAVHLPGPRLPAARTWLRWMCEARQAWMGVAASQAALLCLLRCSSSICTSSSTSNHFRGLSISLVHVFLQQVSDAQTWLRWICEHRQVWMGVAASQAALLCLLRCSSSTCTSSSTSNHFQGLSISLVRVFLQQVSDAHIWLGWMCEARQLLGQLCFAFDLHSSTCLSSTSSGGCPSPWSAPSCSRRNLDHLVGEQHGSDLHRMCWPHTAQAQPTNL